MENKTKNKQKNSPPLHVCARCVRHISALAHRHVQLLLTLRQLPPQLGKLGLQLCDVGTLAVPPMAVPMAVGVVP
jgi:hypothetical protein